MSRLKVGAFLASTDPLFGFNGRGLHITMAYRYGIPAICNGRVDAVAGGLVSYGANLPNTWRQAGVYDLAMVPRPCNFRQFGYS